MVGTKDVDGGRFDCLRITNHFFNAGIVACPLTNPRELIARALAFFKIDDKALPEAFRKAKYADFVLLAVFQQRAHSSWSFVTREQEEYHAAALERLKRYASGSTTSSSSTREAQQWWQSPRARVDMIPSTFIPGYPDKDPSGAGSNRFIVVPLADVLGIVHMIPATEKTKLSRYAEPVNMFFLNSDSDI